FLVHRIVLGKSYKPAGVALHDLRDLAVSLVKGLVRDREDTGFVDARLLISSQDLLRISDGSPGSYQRRTRACVRMAINDWKCLGLLCTAHGWGGNYARSDQEISPGARFCGFHIVFKGRTYLKTEDV